MKLGARIFKTGLAVTLALYAAVWLGFDTPNYAALAAFFAVQPSVHKSFVLIGDQIQANIISAALAIVFVLTFGNEPFVIGVVIMLVIATLIKLKKESLVSLALVTAIIIMGSPTDDFIYFAFDRFLLIILGVVAAFIVNLIFLPPKHENTLYHRIVDTNEEILQWIRLLIRNEADYTVFNKDLKRLDESLEKMDVTFQLFKEERHIFKKNEYYRMRKVVLFRQMMRSTVKARDILQSLSKNKNQLQSLPEDLRQLIVDKIDYLTNYHEKSLLKYSGKAKPHLRDEFKEEIELGKRELTQLFLNYYHPDDADQDKWIETFPIISVVLEYSDELEYFNKLVDSYFKFHKAESRVKVSEREL